MTDSYTQGTVYPFLRLEPHHVEFLRTEIEDQTDEWRAANPKAAALSDKVYEGGDPDYGVELSFEKLEDGSYYLYTETGYSDYTAAFLQELTKDLGIPYITMEAAFTCSRMRPGEFGGGALFVTPKKVHWMNTRSWLDALVKEIGT